MWIVLKYQVGFPLMLRQQLLVCSRAEPQLPSVLKGPPRNLADPSVIDGGNPLWAKYETLFIQVDNLDSLYIIVWFPVAKAKKSSSLFMAFNALN